MLRNYFILITLLFFYLNVSAQEMPYISNFMHNQLLYNPASAGMQETQFNANLVSRFQWSGINGAPLTNMFWTDYRFEGKNMAVGLNINYDKFKANKMTDLFANYAYYISLSHKWKLSMGLRAGTTLKQFDTDDLKNVWDADDRVVSESAYSYYEPVAGAGFQLMSRNTYLGISAPNLINEDKLNLSGNKDRNFFSKKRSYMLLGGHTIKLNDSYTLQPNIRVLYLQSGHARADINLLFGVTDYFWAGGTYSTSGSHSLMAGTHLSSRIKFAYAYELISKQISNRLFTHEINLMINMDNLFKKSN